MFATLRAPIARSATLSRGMATKGKDPVKELFLEKLKSLSKKSTPQETLKKVVVALKKRA
eukprot:m.430324 g.430324  ORF g.430324 m.430324 type:complete len:60 (+) comp17147_c0_seq1:31-210(+)